MDLPNPPYETFNAVKGFSSISSSPSPRERIEVRVGIKLLQGRLDKNSVINKLSKF
jgi:hypothetical protein